MMDKKLLQQRISLMMNYDLTKTLNENKVNNGIILEDESLNEAGISTIGGVAVESLLKQFGEILAKSAEGIELISKDGEKVLARNAKDIEDALKEGRYTSKTLGEIWVGLLKSPETPENVVNQIINNPKFVDKFHKTYSGVKPQNLDQVLTTKGYPEKVREKMIAKYGGLEKDAFNTKFKPGTSDVASQITKDTKVPQGGINITTGDGSPVYFTQIIDSEKVKVSWNERGKPTKIKDPITGNEETVIEPKPTTPEPPIKDPTKVPKGLKAGWAYALGVLSGGALVYWLMFKSKNKVPPTFSPCLADLVNSGAGTLASTTAGDPTVIVKQSGRYPDLDAKGGLWFYTNGRVVSADKGLTKRGTWTCTSGKLQTVAEDTTTGLGYNDALLNTNKPQATTAAGGDVLKNIKITWDGEGSNPTPNPNPNPNPAIQYHDCSQKNLDNGDTLEIGCISPLIKNIQDCLISKNIRLTGGADSKFGPSLSAYLNGKKVIDKAEYDRLMAICADQKVADTSGMGDDSAEYLNGQNQTTGTTTTPTTAEPELHHGPDSSQAPNEAPANVVAPSAPEETGEQLFKKWVGTYFRNKLGGKKQAIGQNRLFYKGPDLTQADFDKLNQYLQQNGYQLTNDQHAKRFGDKYVWNLNNQEQPAAAEPQQISEEFIKNIVGKHLRSKL
jgi:hypothetical protein